MRKFMIAVLALSLIGGVVAGCGAGTSTSEDQDAKRKELDKQVQQSPDADKIER